MSGSIDPVSQRSWQVASMTRARPWGRQRDHDPAHGQEVDSCGTRAYLRSRAHRSVVHRAQVDPRVAVRLPGRHLGRLRQLVEAGDFDAQMHNSAQDLANTLQVAIPEHFDYIAACKDARQTPLTMSLVLAGIAALAGVAALVTLAMPETRLAAA